MAKKKTLHARLNHGRWIVDCPNCAGAEFAVDGQPFICMSEYVPKAMAAGAISHEAVWLKAQDLARAAGQVYPVAFPDDRAEIERVVSGRPDNNQNWESGETLDDLKKENKMHGAKTPRAKKVRA